MVKINKKYHDLKPADHLNFTESVWDGYFDKLHWREESAEVIERKLKSVKKFLDWAKKKGIVEEKEIKKIEDRFRSELRSLKMEDRKIPTPKFQLPNPLPTSHFPLQYYIAFLIILLFTATLGAGIYNQFFKKTSLSMAYPTAPTRAGRMLSFQGRLTDSLGNPITTATNVTFKLYNVSTGGTALYTAGACSLTPDQDGIMNVLVGGSGYSPTPPQTVCGAEVDSGIFTENANIYMGITVGADTEMTPRQQIANVGYAINAETLQGFPPGTATSNIPYINSDGNLLIAAASPGVRSINTSANFTLSSANAVTLVSASSGDIVLQATESGSLKMRTGGSSEAFTRLTIANGGNVPFRLLSLPLYLVGQVHRLVREASGRG